jgi:hypothetical protein
VREAIQKLVEKENTDRRKVVGEEEGRMEEVLSPYNSSTWMMITNTVKLSSLRHQKITLL